MDLTTDAGRDTAFELLSDADVFLTNVRPGALQRLGLDFESVSARNPRLVYGLITGYGETGPDADRAAYDVAAFWSRAGVAHLLTRPGDTPPFQRGGMGDHSAGMTLAAAVCAALLARERTGTGQLVSTSLYRQGAYTVSFDLNTYLLTGQPIAVGQRESMGNPCMNNYAAGDGRRFWIVGLEVDRALARAVSCRGPRPSGCDDPDSATPGLGAANAAQLIAELDEIFATSPLDEWAQVFAGEPDFFWSPVNTLEDVVADEQFHAAGGIVDVPDGRTQATVPDGRHTGGFPRHAVGAAFCGTATRTAHRRGSRRTRGAPRAVTGPLKPDLYKFASKVSRCPVSRVTGQPGEAVQPTTTSP